MKAVYLFFLFIGSLSLASPNPLNLVCKGQGYPDFEARVKTNPQAEWFHIKFSSGKTNNKKLVDVKGLYSYQETSLQAKKELHRAYMFVFEYRLSSLSRKFNLVTGKPMGPWILSGAHDSFVCK